MTKLAIENRFLLFWITLLFAAGGVLIYRDMPLELLPNQPQRTFAIVFLNGPDSPAQNMTAKRSVVTAALDSIAVEGPVTGEADDRTTRFLFSASAKDPHLESKLVTLIANAQRSRGDRSWFRVVSLGADHLPSVEIVISAHGAQQAQDPLRDQSRNHIAELERKSRDIVTALQSTGAVGKVVVEGARSAVVEVTEDPFQQPPGFMVGSALQDAATSLGQSHTGVQPSGAGYTWQPLGPPAGLALRETPSPSNAMVMLDDQPAVLLRVFRADGRDDLQVSQAVKTVLDNVSAEAEDSLSASDVKALDYRVVSDASRYIVEAEENVISNLVVGTVLTCLCILIFVRRFWATSLVSISIPLALILTIPILYLLGISRNVMSLAGAALGVGIVVDATLGSLSSFNERMAAGYLPVMSAHHSANENQIPLLITSLSTLAVFMPILLLEGVVGAMFWDLSVTVIVGQIVGFFVSVYLMPGIASLLHEQKQTHLDITRTRVQTQHPSSETQGSNPQGSDDGSQDNLFFRSLTLFLKRPRLGLVFNGLLISAIVASVVSVPPSEFLPAGDSKEFHALIGFEGLVEPKEREALSHQVAEFLAARGFQDRLLKSDRSEISVTFRGDQPVDLRALNDELARIAYPHASGLFRINPLEPQSRSGDDVEIFLVGRTNPDTLRSFVTEVQNLPGVMGTRETWESRVQMIQPRWGESPLQAAWIPADKAPALERLLGEPTPLGMTSESQAPLVFSAKASEEHALVQGSRFPGALLDSHQSLLTERSRLYDLQGSLREKLSIDIDGVPSGAIESQIQKLAAQWGVSFEWHPRSAENREGFLKLVLCLLSAVGIIAAIILVQTRSLAMTVVVLFTFLWGPIGSIPGLIIHGESLSASALVGFILLAGTIVNNGILLVDLIAKNRNAQMDPVTACVQAARERALPVVITSLTTVLGTLPLVFETGAGSQMYRGLAIVVVYGTTLSTPISLYGVPSLFLLLSALREWGSRWFLRMRIRMALTSLPEPCPYGNSGGHAHVRL